MVGWKLLGHERKVGFSGNVKLLRGSPTPKKGQKQDKVILTDDG